MKLALLAVLLLLAPVVAEDFLSGGLYVDNAYYPDYFSQSQNISTLAAQIAEGASSPTEAAFKINSWIRARSHYNLNQKYWTSDAAVLDSSITGVCLDFAGLEVGMLRSLGIPSRVIYATLDQVNGHAWVEFSDGQRWVQSDPTHGTFNTESYYCYLGYKILDIYTVVDGQLVTLDKLGYTDCEQKSDYIDVIIWTPIMLVVIISAVVLTKRYLEEKEKEEEERLRKDAK